MSSNRFRFLDADTKKRPPNYSSKKTQRKLLMLIGSLFFVIYAMQQVGRPEYWQWLVQLDRNAKLAQSKQASDASLNVESDDTTNRRLPDSAEAAEEQGGRGSHQQGAASGLAVETTALEVLYWNAAFERLESEEMFGVVSYLAELSSNSVTDKTQASMPVSAIAKLIQMRQIFTDQVKQGAALHSARSSSEESIEPPKSELDQDVAGSADLPDRSFGQTVGIQIFDLPDEISLQQAQAVEDRTRWLLLDWQPAVEAQKAVESEVEVSGVADLTLGEMLQRQADWKKVLIKFVDPWLKNQILDGSRLGRPDERAAWLRWIQLVADTAGDDPTDAKPQLVTRQNLMGQANQFRGKWVWIKGTLRRLETKRQSTAAIKPYVPSGQYVAAWIQPGLVSQGPYCVYVLDDPQLLEMANHKTEFHRGIQVKGVFFKLFPYPVSETKTAVAPLLIAGSVSLTPTATVAKVTPPTSGQWSLLIGSVTVLAAVLGIAAWFSTRYRSANPIGQRLYKAGRLNWLDQTEVPSVGESLQRMADKDEVAENDIAEDAQSIEEQGDQEQSDQEQTEADEPAKD